MVKYLFVEFGLDSKNEIWLLVDPIAPMFGARR